MQLHTFCLQTLSLPLSLTYLIFTYYLPDNPEKFSHSLNYNSDSESRNGPLLYPLKMSHRNEQCFKFFALDQGVIRGGRGAGELWAFLLQQEW